MLMKGINMSIHNELKKLRKLSGVSQQYVADICKWKSRQYVSNLERGVSMPPINSLDKLSKIYNVELDYLKEFILSESISNYEKKMRKKLWPKSKRK